MNNAVKSKQNPRLIGLDVFRGIAVILMVIYHFSFDLDNFGYLALDVRHSFAWRIFSYGIISCFLFVMGISLLLSHNSGIQAAKVWKRIGWLGLACILISIGSWSQFPQTWIYFGILHLIFLSSLLGLFFLNKPILSLITACVILIATNLGYLHTHILFQWLQPILNLPNYTEDLTPIFPWFAIVLFGIAFAKYGLHNRLFSQKIWQSPKSISQLLGFLGRHSLIVYLIHQPILFGIFILIA